MKLVLYGTLDCHLCEQAAELFDQLTDEFYLEHIDISGSEKLAEQYGIRIPVVKKESGDELGWPFDQKSLEEFLRG